MGFNYDIIKIALDNEFIRKRNAVKLLNILKYGRLTCEHRPHKAPQSQSAERYSGE